MQLASHSRRRLPHVEVPTRFVEVLTDFLATTDPHAPNLADFQDLLLRQIG